MIRRRLADGTNKRGRREDFGKTVKTGDTNSTISKDTLRTSKKSFKAFVQNVIRSGLINVARSFTIETVAESLLRKERHNMGISTNIQWCDHTFQRLDWLHQGCAWVCELLCRSRHGQAKASRQMGAKRNAISHVGCVLARSAEVEQDRRREPSELDACV